jgi:hypothetical protein
MQLHSENRPTVNDVRGRGLKHRKLTREQRVRLVADFVTGEKRLELSLAQFCSLLDVTPVAVRAELKARAAANGNGLSQGVERLVETWAGLSHTEREQALQAIGVADVWDVLAKIVG